MPEFSTFFFFFASRSLADYTDTTMHTLMVRVTLQATLYWRASSRRGFQEVWRRNDPELWKNRCLGSVSLDSREYDAVIWQSSRKKLTFHDQI